MIFFLFVSSAAESPLLQQEFINQSKDQQRHLCGGMSNAIASSVAPSTLVGTRYKEDFTAHKAIDNDKGTYFKSKEMNESSSSTVEWIRVHFTGLHEEVGEEVCGKYLKAVRLRNYKTYGWCNSTHRQNCLWVSSLVKSDAVLKTMLYSSTFCAKKLPGVYIFDMLEG